MRAESFHGVARAALPVVLGYLGIGIAAGVVERSAGFSYAEVLLVSTVLYAGSAQFVLPCMFVGLLVLQATAVSSIALVLMVSLASVATAVSMHFFSPGPLAVIAGVALYWLLL